MNTGTRATRQQAAKVWEPVLAAAGAQAQELGEQILALAHQVAAHRLSAPLTDPSRNGADKAALVSDLFAGKVDERVVTLAQELVQGRWSKPVDLISALHDFGIEAVLTGARVSNALTQIEHELFAVRSVIMKNRQLRQALSPSRRTDSEDRVRLAQSLFAPHISHCALTLLTWCVRHHAEGGVTYNLRRVAQLAAAMQKRVIADVTSAVNLTQAQCERLRASLRKRLGMDVELNCSVDPQIVGGVKVAVGDFVVDSTISSSLHNLRDALTPKYA